MNLFGAFIRALLYVSLYIRVYHDSDIITTTRLASRENFYFKNFSHVFAVNNSCWFHANEAYCSDSHVGKLLKKKKNLNAAAIEDKVLNHLQYIFLLLFFFCIDILPISDINMQKEELYVYIFYYYYLTITMP